MIDFDKKMTRESKLGFATYMLNFQDKIGFKVSARGWCYLMEGEGVIDKGQFNKVERWINNCRKEGYLPIDFVAEEEARSFKGIDEPTGDSYEDFLMDYLGRVRNFPYYYEPDWWNGEKYYIQMVVEKIDLVTLAMPICKKYHIPIANSKGWSSILQRAEYARRFMLAEQDDLQCVLLYFGDYDPDGLRIADNIKKNLTDLQYIVWQNGDEGYDPSYLKIDRIGLKLSFINKYKLTWINNLITGSKKNLASPTHKNHHLSYVQKYLKQIGVRKCEANACLKVVDQTQQYIEKQIQKYLGKDAEPRFLQKKAKVVNEIESIMDDIGVFTALDDFKERLWERGDE